MIKFTEKGQEGRSERLAYLRKQCARLKRLNSYKDSQEWRELRSILEDFVELEKNAQKVSVIACSKGGYWDQQEQAVRKESDSRLIGDCRVAYEREQAFQLVIDLIEKTDSQIETIEKTIKSVEDTYRAAKEQLT